MGPALTVWLVASADTCSPCVTSCPAAVAASLRAELGQALGVCPDCWGPRPLLTVSSPFVSPQWTGAPGRLFTRDSLLGARWPRGPLAPSCQAPAVWRTPRAFSGGQSPPAPTQARAWAVLWTSVRTQGRPQHHRPSDTAGPCPSPRSWCAAGPRGVPAAPRSGRQSPRGDATVAGVPRCSVVAPGAPPCSGAQAQACPGAPCRQLAPPRPWRPGQPQLAAASWTAAKAAPARACPGAPQGPARSPQGAACPSLRST